MKRSRSGTSKALLRKCERTCADLLSSVFTAVAASINVKLSNEDSDEDTVSQRCLHACLIFTRHYQDTPQPSGSSTPLDRTSTGILSNRPQKAGLPAVEAPAASQSVRLGLLALAKRESARRSLYSRFFRGPVLGPDPEVSELLVLEAVKRSLPSRAGLNEPECGISTTEKKGKKGKLREKDGSTGVIRKKRKLKRENETKRERKERRRLKRLRKETEKREICKVRGECNLETGPTKESAEDTVQGGDDAGYSRKKKRKLRECGTMS